MVIKNTGSVLWLKELKLKPRLCDNLEGWGEVGGGRELQEGGNILYQWLIHADVWQ